MDASVSTAFHVLELTGVLTSAVLGGVIARRERLDPIGFATLAILSGLGGGLIRDTLLQHGPPIALTDYRYLVTALAGAVIAYVVRIEGRWWNRLWPVVDALALGAWAAAGAQRTLSFGLILATVVGAGLVLAARRRGWMLPEADAWSAARVVPARYRRRLRSKRHAADREGDR